MATKSFLSESEFARSKKLLRLPSRLPNGDQKSGTLFPNTDFSNWLGKKIENRLKTDEAWLKAGPVAIGSWARSELCPKSDIDLLFCGDESAVSDLVERINEAGLPVRYRVPEDLGDWSVGVGPVDWVAILHGKAFTKEAKKRLSEQQELFKARGRVASQKVVQTLLSEKKARNQRYDSISNFLEPNLKYGAGGLRDLQQALYLIQLLPKKFAENGHVLSVLQYYKHFFLTLRQKLQVLGGSDVLVAQMQLEIGEWLGYPDNLKFMREVQKGLSRVSFYSDWVFETARATKETFQKIENRPLKTVHDCFSALREHPSVLMQYRVRREQDEIFRKKELSERQVGRWLTRYIRPDVDDRFLLGLFRSRLVDKCIPNLRKLVGLVQHNQYHRYTTDTHILQTLRVLLRVYRSRNKSSEMKPLVTKLSTFDWQVLVWTCLYHDIGKGRRGEHSVVGAKIATEDLTKMGQSKKLVNETVWMVKNHLLLSTSAFRKNPRSRDTWRDLQKKGVSGQRLYRLAVFTSIDIQATNPDAWNEWKQGLLVGLVKTLEQPEASKLMAFLELAKRRGVKVVDEFVQGLDVEILQDVPPSVLLDDYIELKKARSALPPKVIGAGAIKWVRLHSKKDGSGVFVGFVQQLFASGTSIRRASVRTFPKFGAYDWFQVRSTKTNSQIKRLLTYGAGKSVSDSPGVRFESIQIMGEGEDELVLSFRGKDRAGALVAAAKTLYDVGLEIRWATVHTWGRMLDDVFGVVMPENSPESSEELLEKMKKALL